MAKGKPTPDKSKIERVRPLAYARRQKGSGGKDDAEAEDKADPAAEPASDAGGESKPGATAEETAAAIKDMVAGTNEPAAEAKADEPAAIEPPPPKAEPWPDATPQPMRPVEPARARGETVAMPAELATGSPPAMPVTPGSVEDPTAMPAPRDVQTGHPDDPALPPGRVPSGDSRSLRKDSEFALVYRVGTAVIIRSGVVGTRGTWRVVEYPTSSSASNAYAKEVSRFVAEGFSDYRE